MTVTSTIKRYVAFGRHIPPSKLGRRVALSVRRKLRDRFASPTLGASQVLDVRADAPRPIFLPRMQLWDQDRLHLAFLGQSVAFDPAQPDWTSIPVGAAHQLLRMNLHYMEYLEALSDAALQSAVDSWIAANPAHRPGTWRDGWNSYALSLRVVVWLQQLAARPHLPSEFRSRAYAAAAGQLAFLSDNLETDLGGNHLIKNIKALAWAGATYDGVVPARWVDRAVTLLDRELDHQILADGVHDERSASYHAQVFADLLETRHALLRCDGQQNTVERLDRVLAAMAQALADLTHPDGLACLFNDAGMTMAYAPQVCLDAYAASGAAPPLPRGVFAFAAAGYYGLRSPRLYLVADCGRIAPDDLPAHGHGDVLSFELSADAKRFIVDQGVFEYISGPKRQAARAASSHNTLAIDGADQADFFGAFRCGRRPDVLVHDFKESASGFVLDGSHNGYAHLAGQPRHRRRFDASPGRVVLIDTIEGKTDRAVSSSLLLHPDCTVSVAADRATLDRDGTRLVVTCEGAALVVEDAVWWPDMGHERLTRRLRIVWPTGRSTVTTTLELDDTKSQSGAAQ